MDIIANTATRATKAPARAKAAPPTAINNEVDILVAKVATIIGDLVKVVVESPFSDDYAARNAFLEADGLLIGLAAPPGPNDYWDESKPRKPIADQMLAIDGYLKQAVAALLNDEAQRPGERLFRLSMAEQASALIAQLHEAYEGLPGTSAALAALTDFQQPIAGARQFRDRPSPPIRRTDGLSDGHGPYNHAQLCAIITETAGVALTLDRVLMLAQVDKDDWDKSVLVDAAQLLARQLGAMADSAVGGEIYGTHDTWHYGPNFAAQGKAGAA